MAAVLLAARRPELVRALVVAEAAPPADRAWADGLEERADGLRPAFEIDMMVASLAETSQRDYWDEWRRVSCPTLVVRAGDGGVPEELVERMVGEAQNATSAVVPDAGHDLHLCQPERWRDVVEAFLARSG